MASKLVWTMPTVAVFLIGSWGVTSADTSDVKSPAPLVVGKSGKHCKDDPHCFNRYHYAIRPAAHVNPGQLFVLETRDALDSDLTFDSNPQDVAAVNLNLVHPLTGPVYVEGAKRGDALAVTVVDIAPDDFGYTTIVPGFGSLEVFFLNLFSFPGNLRALKRRPRIIREFPVPLIPFLATLVLCPGNRHLRN